MAAPTRVQSAVNNASALSVSTPFGSNNTAGNTGFAFIDVLAGTPDLPTSITDTNHNTWVLLGSLLDNADFVGMAVYWCQSLNGGANTVTTHHASTNDIELYILETTPAQVDTIFSITFNDTGGGAGTTTATVGPQNTTFANELVMAFTTSAGSGGPSSAGSGFAFDANSPSNSNSTALEYNTFATSGTAVTATVNMTQQTSWVIVMLGIYTPTGAPTYVQHAVFESTTSPASPQTVVLNGTTAGNTIVVVAVGEGSAGPLVFYTSGDNVEDTQTNNYNNCYAPGTILPATYQSSAIANAATFMMFASHIIGGNNTISVFFTPPASGTWTLGLYAFEIGGTSVFDAGVSALGTSALATTGVWTVNNASDIIISVAFNAAKAAASSESYTLIANTATLGACLQYKTGVAASSQTSTASYGASEAWVISSGAFGNPAVGIPYITQYCENFSESNGNSLTLNNVSKGNILCAVLDTIGTTGTQIVSSASISDTATNSWQFCTGTQASSPLNGGIFSSIFYAIAKSSGDITITTVLLPSSISGNVFSELAVFELTAANAFDVGVSLVNNPNSTTFVATTGLFPTVYRNEIIIVGVPAEATITSAVSGYTVIDQNDSIGTYYYYGNIASSGSQVFNATTSSNTFQAIIFAASFYFKLLLPNDPLFFGIT